MLNIFPIIIFMELFIQKIFKNYHPFYYTLVCQSISQNHFFIRLFFFLEQFQIYNKIERQIQRFSIYPCSITHTQPPPLSISLTRMGFFFFYDFRIAFNTILYKGSYRLHYTTKEVKTYPRKLCKSYQWIKTLGFHGPYSMDVFGWVSTNFNQFDFGIPAVATAYFLQLLSPISSSQFLWHFRAGHRGLGLRQLSYLPFSQASSFLGE